MDFALRKTSFEEAQDRQCLHHVTEGTGLEDEDLHARARRLAAQFEACCEALGKTGFQNLLLCSGDVVLESV